MEQQEKDIKEIIEKPQEIISDSDRVILEMAKMRQKLTIANLEKAAAQKEAAENYFKCLVLQLYLKYKLDPEVDYLDENDGNIMRGALKKEEE